MSRSGLAGPSMENHMDMSHLQMPKHMSVPPQEEPSDLEELEQFAKAFKQRRIKLGFTQVITHTPSFCCWWWLVCACAGTITCNPKNNMLDVGDNLIVISIQTIKEFFTNGRLGKL